MDEFNCKIVVDDFSLLCKPPESYKKTYDETARVRTAEGEELSTKIAEFNIKDYEFGDVIKHGGEGIVLKCIHTPTNSKLATKITKNYGVKSEFVSDYLGNEKRIYRKIQNCRYTTRLLLCTKTTPPLEIMNKFKRDEIPYLTQTYGNKGNLTFLTFMKLYESNLEDYLKINRGRISEIHLQELMLSIGIALKDLQKNKIAHRDIKLNNILVDENEQAYITDFGFAVELDDNFQYYCNEHKAPSGNWPHTSYEVRRTKLPSKICYYKQTSFEFGFLIHEILFGKEPFIDDRNEIRTELSLEEKEKYSRYLKLIDHLLKENEEERISITDAVKIIKYPFQSISDLYYYRNNNLLEGYYKLAVSYYNGKKISISSNLHYEIEKNYFYAFQLFEFASNLEGDFNDSLYAKCYYYLGICYYFGHGIQQNFEKSFFYFKKSSDLHFHPATFNLAHFYFFGFGKIERNYQKVFSIFNDFVRKEKFYEYHSIYYLALCYEYGIGTIECPENAFRFFQLSYNTYNNDLLSIVKMAKIHYFGLFGVDVSYSKAFTYFERAATLNCPISQFYLGLCYDLGLGTDFNCSSAFKWFKCSADQNYLEAQYHVALCYEFGQGIEKNLKNAVHYYSISSNSGYTCSHYKLALLYLDNNEYELAFKLFELAANDEHTDSIFQLALCYHHGYGTNKNLDKALILFEKAANLGNCEAKKYL